MVATLFVGAVHDTSSSVSPDVAVDAAGGSGTPGVLVVDGDQSLSPKLLEARTCTW